MFISFNGTSLATNEGPDYGNSKTRNSLFVSQRQASMPTLLASAAMHPDARL